MMPPFDIFKHDLVTNAGSACSSAGLDAFPGASLLASELRQPLAFHAFASSAKVTYLQCLLPGPLCVACARSPRAWAGHH